jgi:hypothetical protein
VHKRSTLQLHSVCPPKVLTMKKKNTMPTATVAPQKEFSLIDEALLKSRIYTIRGVKVMLDADLAEIYGYSTKVFNRQVKNNLDRFPEEFRFQLNTEEIKILRCKLGMRTNSWTQLEDASCTLLKNKSPRRWKHSMI